MTASKCSGEVASPGWGELMISSESQSLGSRNKHFHTQAFAPLWGAPDAACSWFAFKERILVLRHSYLIHKDQMLSHTFRRSETKLVLPSIFRASYIPSSL